MKIQTKHKKLELSMSYKGKRKIKSDEHRLKQVLINLLSNAIKFTQKGAIKIDVEDLPETKKVSVSDTGYVDSTLM